MSSVGSNGESFLRQLSLGGGREQQRGSKRWRRKSKGDEGNEMCSKSMFLCKKRVMVVIDNSCGAKQAMMWALTHVANKGDLVTLLHVNHHARVGGEYDDLHSFANSLAELCKECKPEVEVEALVVQGPKLATVLNQVKKLEVSVLVLSQGRPSFLCCIYPSSCEEFVEECIDMADCLTMAVRKQSNGVSGYLVTTRWQKNFWLLA